MKDKLKSAIIVNEKLVFCNNLMLALFIDIFNEYE